MRALAIAWLAAACSSPARPSEEQARPTVQTPAPAPSVMAPAAAPTPTTADAAATAAPDRPLLSYGGVSVFGADEFVILQDGRMRFSFTAPGKPDNEWHELPAAAACVRIIDRLRRRVR